MELTKRKQNILASIVNGYIRTGGPVGSKSIAEAAGASPATVRNEMAELTEMGLLEQPHTSAGRIPSEKGLREYVDNLMPEEPLSDEERITLDAMLAKSAFDPERLPGGAARTLASATRYMAVATAPSGVSAQIKAVQFVQTSRRTAMLILISSAGTMKTKVFHCDFDLSSEIMRIFFRVLNERVVGRNVSEINRAFIQSLAVSFNDFALLMSPALLALLETAQETVKTEVHVSGQMNLLFYPELGPGGARRVMDFIERQDAVTGLLAGRPGRVQIHIGQENGHNALAAVSVVSTRYSINGTDAGAVAVIGPTRMRYAHTAAQTAYIAERVGEMFTRVQREE